MKIYIYDNLIAEVVINQLYDIENWFFVSLCGINDLIYFYSENFMKKLTYFSNNNGLNMRNIEFNQVKFSSLSSQIEISNFQITKNFINFYNLTKKKIFFETNFPPIDCDTECVKCDENTGICLECSYRKIPMNNTCPMIKHQIIQTVFLDFSKNQSQEIFKIKNYISDKITNFKSFNYTLAFYFKSIIDERKSGYQNEYYIVSFHNSQDLSKNVLEYSFVINNNTLYLKYFDLVKNFKQYKPLINNFNSWKNIFVSHNVKENILTIFIFNQCQNLTNNITINNIFLLPLNTDSFIKIGGVSDSSNFNGYLYDISVYSNKVFDLKTITISQGIIRLNFRIISK